MDHDTSTSVNLPKKLKILVIDDDEVDRQLIFRFLQNYRDKVDCIEEANDFDSGFSKILKKTYDCVLLDYKLPGRTGVDVLSKLKQFRFGLAPVPIVVLSTVSDDDFGLKMLRLGAQDYLIKKGLNHAVLMRSIRYSIERHRIFLELEKHRAKEYEELEIVLKSRFAKAVGSIEAPVALKNKKHDPLDQRFPLIIGKIETAYSQIIDKYLNAIQHHEPPPHSEIKNLAQKIGDYDGTPNDVMQIHNRVLQAKCEASNKKRASAYSNESRLLAVEVMGHLADYYRIP